MFFSVCYIKANTFLFENKFLFLAFFLGIIFPLPDSLNKVIETLVIGTLHAIINGCFLSVAE